MIAFVVGMMQNVKRELETRMVVDSYNANGPALPSKASGASASETSEASGSDAEVSAHLALV